MISESFRLGFFFAPIQLLQPGKKNSGTLEPMTFGNLPGFGGLTFKNRDRGLYFIYTLEVQRLCFEWFFRKDYCFSRDLQSTIQGDYSFYGL